MDEAPKIEEACRNLVIVGGVLEAAFRDIYFGSAGQGVNLVISPGGGGSSEGARLLDSFFA